MRVRQSENERAGGIATAKTAYAVEQITRTEERAANRVVREVVGKAERGAVLPIAEAGKVIDKAVSFITRGFAALLKINPLDLLGLFDFGAGAPPSKEQAHQKAQAAGNLETQHAQAHAAAEQVKAAEKDEQIFRADQEQQLPLAAPEYFRAIPRPGRGHDHGREIERERD